MVKFRERRFDSDWPKALQLTKNTKNQPAIFPDTFAKRNLGQQIMKSRALTVIAGSNFWKLKTHNRELIANTFYFCPKPRFEKVFHEGFIVQSAAGAGFNGSAAIAG